MNANPHTHAIEISADDIEVVENCHRETSLPYFELVFHKPMWPGVMFTSGKFRKESQAHATREAIFAWLRELGVEVRP